MSLTPEQQKARAFILQTSRIRNRWAEQPLSELRGSAVDLPVRKALAAVARECSGLLDGTGAEFTLDSLIGLDSDIGPGRPPVTKEEVIDWIDMVGGALDARYRTGSADATSLERRVLTARLPTALSAQSRTSQSVPKALQ